MSKNVVIVNFNTQALTDACVNSLNKHTSGLSIFIFDNSNKEPFNNTHKNVTVLDNTKGQIIDFDNFGKIVPLIPNFSSVVNGYASAKHAYTIQKCCDMFDDGFLLLDSDVIIKRDVSELFDNNYLYVADVGFECPPVKRVLPFICYINTKMMHDNGLSYYNNNYMLGVGNRQTKRYDTGAYLYIVGQQYKTKRINNKHYINHFTSGSWETAASNILKRKTTSTDFLAANDHFTKTTNKKLVFTIVENNSSQIQQPNIKSDTDYVAFVNTLDGDYGLWEPKLIPCNMGNLSNDEKIAILREDNNKYDSIEFIDTKKTKQRIMHCIHRKVNKKEFNPTSFYSMN